MSYYDSHHLIDGSTRGLLNMPNQCNYILTRNGSEESGSSVSTETTNLRTNSNPLSENERASETSANFIQSTSLPSNKSSENGLSFHSANILHPHSSTNSSLNSFSIIDKSSESEYTCSFNSRGCLDRQNSVTSFHSSNSSFSNLQANSCGNQSETNINPDLSFLKPGDEEFLDKCLSEDNPDRKNPTPQIVPPDSQQFGVNNSKIVIDNSQGINICSNTTNATIPLPSSIPGQFSNSNGSFQMSTPENNQNGHSANNFQDRKSISLEEQILDNNINFKIDINNQIISIPRRKVSQTNSVPPKLPPDSGRTELIGNVMLNNCNGVDMAPKVIFNIPAKHINQEIEKPVDTESSVLEFKEALKKAYKRQTCSRSFLPWHRGTEFIPIDDYYTETLIFPVNKKGNDSEDRVDLVAEIEASAETRFLVEGEAGMGKTLLLLKLAQNWAKGLYLQKFQVLIVISLRDFQGTIEEYVKNEFLTTNFNPKTFDAVWDYCQNNEILFVLDGYDELKHRQNTEIHKLLKGKSFSNSKVIVTSRPEKEPPDCQKKLRVKGFNQRQMFEFIEKYFKIVDESSGSCSSQSGELKKIILGDPKYGRLAKRPLFCVFLCMLFENSSCPEKNISTERLSDFMKNIMLSLIKWNRKNEQKSSDLDKFPPEYEKAFHDFGKLCLEALKNEKLHFTESEMKDLGILKNLGFLCCTTKNTLTNIEISWNPLHQTFIEYLAAYYISQHVLDCRECEREFKDTSIVFEKHIEVLKFTVGILENNAHRIFKRKSYSVFNTDSQKSEKRILKLLRESGSCTKNCQAVATLLDRKSATISSSESEFVGWGHILPHVKLLKRIDIIWRIKSTNPDQESSFEEASETDYELFFTSLRNNISVTDLYITGQLEGQTFSQKNFDIFFKFLKIAFQKKNLRHIDIAKMITEIDPSSYIKDAIVKATEKLSSDVPKCRPYQDLRSISLGGPIANQDLHAICNALRRSALNLKELKLVGLEHGQDGTGFEALVELLKENKNIHSLHFSMNNANFSQSHKDEKGESYSPSELKKDKNRMPGEARDQSKHAYENSQFLQQKSNETPDPTKELNYLFDNTEWKSLKANKYWFIKDYKKTNIPLPMCITRNHDSVFHFLFDALPSTHLKTLIIDKAFYSFTTKDMVCLGDSIRRSTKLRTLCLKDLQSSEKYIPILLSLGPTCHLETVNLTSAIVQIEEGVFDVACEVLKQNTSLRSLTLSSWHFHISDTLKMKQRLSDVLKSWHVNYLDLNNCVVKIGSPKTGSQSVLCQMPVIIPINGLPVESKSLKTLLLEGLEVRDNIQETYLHTHQLMHSLRHCSYLTTLDLTKLPNRQSTTKDAELIDFFNIIGSSLRDLKSLTLSRWEINITKHAELGHSLKACNKLRYLYLHEVNEIRQRKEQSEGIFIGNKSCSNTVLHQLVNNLKLEELSLIRYKVDYVTIDFKFILLEQIASCFCSHWDKEVFRLKISNSSNEVESILKNGFGENTVRNPCKVTNSKSHAGLLNLKIHRSFFK